MKKIFFFTKEEAKEFLTKVSPEDLYNVFVEKYCKVFWRRIPYTTLQVRFIPNFREIL